MQDRVTVIEQIYHQPEGKSPTLSEARFDRELETTGQLYKRIELEAVENEWRPLIPPGCWLQKPGMIFVENEEGKFFSINPSVEELAEINQRVLLISDNPRSLSEWEVLPRESMRGINSNPLGLLVKSRKGTTRYTITVYPA